MFTLGHMILAVVLTWILTAFVCLFISGTSVNKHKEKAYRTGYEQGYIDGRKGK